MVGGGQDAYLQLEIKTNDYIRVIQENKSHAVGGSVEQPKIIEETEVNQENNGNAVQPDNGQQETVEKMRKMNSRKSIRLMMKKIQVIAERKRE